MVDQVERIPGTEQRVNWPSHFLHGGRTDAPIILTVVHEASGSASNADKPHEGEDDGDDDQLYVLTTVNQQSDVKKWMADVLLPAPGVSSKVGNVYGKGSNGAECTVECTEPCPCQLRPTKASLLLKDRAATCRGKRPTEHGEEGRGHNDGL